MLLWLGGPAVNMDGMAQGVLQGVVVWLGFVDRTKPVDETRLVD